jgi:hypothetical protein
LIRRRLACGHKLRSADTRSEEIHQGQGTSGAGDRESSYLMEFQTS